MRSRSRGVRDRSRGSGIVVPGSPRARRAARARPARRSRPSACARTASTTSASGTSNGRSTFIETCATPRRRARTPIARTPGSPSAPPSRISAAIRARVGDGRGRGELQVERDQRRARARRASPRRSGAGAAGRSRDAARPRRSARASPATPAAAQLRAGAPAGELAVEEHGHRQLLRRSGRPPPAPRRTRRPREASSR